MPAFSMGAEHSTYQLICVFLWEKAEEHFFLAKKVRNDTCISPFKGGTLGKYGVKWLSFSSDNKHSTHVSTCKAALVNI